MDWDRFGRKGQRCEIVGGRSSYVQVCFMDGHTLVVNRQALRRAKPSELKVVDGKDEIGHILAAVPHASEGET